MAEDPSDIGEEDGDATDLIAAVLDGEVRERDPVAEPTERPAIGDASRPSSGDLVEELTLIRDGFARLRREHFDDHRDAIAAAILGPFMLWFCWRFIGLAISDYRNFGTFHFDTAIFDQAAHLLSEGKQFMSSRGLNVFGHHANFGLYLFAPFYWLGLGGPILLNSAMIVSLALAAVPVYLIARDRTGSAAVATTISLAFLLHFSVSATIHEEFHPESMAVLPLFAAFWFAERGRWEPYTFALVYAVCWKEDIALFVAMLGVYLFFTGARKVGAVTAVAAGAYFLAITTIVLPALGVGAAFYAGDYGALGDSGLEVALNASVFDRDEAFRLLDKNGAGSYLFDLGQPYGWLAYLSPLWMLLALPQLAANLLNIHGLAANPFAHYVSVPLVALTLGLIATFANRPGVLLRSVMAVWLLLLAFNTSVSRGYMPYSDNYRSGVWQLFENDRSRELRGAIEVVPDDAAVVATYNLSPQLARRDEVYMWPNPYRREYWGAGDAPALPDPGFVEYLALDRSTMGEESREFADEVIAVWGFETVYENGPVSVLRRPPDGDG